MRPQNGKREDCCASSCCLALASSPKRLNCRNGGRRLPEVGIFLFELPITYRCQTSISDVWVRVACQGMPCTILYVCVLAHTHTKKMHEVLTRTGGAEEGARAMGEKETRVRTLAELACLLDSSPTNNRVFTVRNACLAHFALLSHSSSSLRSWLSDLSLDQPLIASARAMCSKGTAISAGSSSLYLTLPPSVKLSSCSPGDLVRAEPAAALLNPAQPQYVRRMMGLSPLN